MNNQETNNNRYPGNGKSGAENQKEFGLSSFSINNRISVLVMVVLVAILGIQSYLNIPKEASPDITIPNIMVITTYPGVSPEDMESLITRKLEDELSNISDIKEMTSTTAEGYSNINIEFNSDVNIDDALQKVREKVDLAKPELPSEAEDPIIQEINFAEFPIMQVNISGRYGLVQLKQVAEDLQEQIEAVPSVLEVDLAGGLEREVKVDVNLPKLKYYGLTFGDIIAAIQRENVTIPGGNIDVGIKKFLLRVPGEFSKVEPIEDIVVDAPDDKPIYIRDLASVSFGFKERETYAELNNNPVISLSVIKRSGENILETSSAVKSILEDELPNLPPTTHFEITSDQSKDINSMVSSLENNIISGLLLVVGILLFFLGVRNASFVGIAIPMSMFLSFIIISSLGMTMNMIVLFSLILALGMLVDNAIVVVENIYRYIEEGFDNFAAAKKGTGEVAVPIISGTLTTLAAFFPLLFWPGVVGEFMSYLPLTLIITLSSSLFVALVINPVLCALFMNIEQGEGGADKPKMTRRGKIFVASVASVILLIGLFNSVLTWMMLFVSGLILWLLNRYVMNPLGSWWQRKGLNTVLEKYEKTLRWSLDHSKTIVGISVLLLFSSFAVFAIFNPGMEFFPEDIPPSRVYVQVEAPVGTNVDFTKSVVDTLENKVPNIPNHEDIESVLSTSGSAITADPFSGQGNSSHLGTIVLNFVDYQQREGSSFDALEFARSNFGSDIAGAEVTVEEEQQGPPSGKPVNLEISGKNMDELERISEEIILMLETDPVYGKLDGLESDLPEPSPEIHIDVDREKAAVFGLSTEAIGNTVRQAINGVEASEYRDGKDEYDIVVRLDEQFRNDLSALQELTIVDEERQIPLSSVASWDTDEGLGGIKHKDQERVVTVMADVRSGYNPNAVLQEVQTVLDDYLSNIPAGYDTRWTGEQEEQEEAIDFLSMAFMIALFLMAFILISQFNSISKPFIVMTSVIMSTAGVFFGLTIFQMPFVIIMTGIGVISLAGVVVNNAIVLIDYIDILRKRDNMPLYEALVQGGIVRFRPVVLTALTTTLGLVPLAIGFNLDFITLVNAPAEFFTNIGEYLYWGGEQAAWWAPMAIAVINGLIFATFLTLILVPVLYYLFEKGRRNVNIFFFDEKDPGIIVSTSEANGNQKKHHSTEKSVPIS